MENENFWIKNFNISEKEEILKLFFLDYIKGYNLVTILINLPKNLYFFINKYILRWKITINPIKLKIDFYPINKIINILY